MAQNIELLGATYSDVPSVELPKVGGGMASFVDVSGTTAVASDVESGKKFILANGVEATGSYVWDWRGRTYEWVSSPGEFATTLDKTAFNGWEYSKTAKVIITSSNLGTFSADPVNYEYLLRWRFQCDVAAKSGATLKIMPIRQIAEIWQGIYKRPYNYTAYLNDTYNNNVCTTILTAPVIKYYSSSGAVTIAYTASYGIYPGATAATFSNATTDSPTVTIKTPTVSARCSDTYMSVARAADIDQENTIISWKCDLYKTPIGGELRSIYESAIDLMKNPINIPLPVVEEE